MGGQVTTCIMGISHHTLQINWENSVLNDLWVYIVSHQYLVSGFIT